jgi:hypothetical protein
MSDAPDIDLTEESSLEKRKRTRAWSAITGITLHQTGVHGFGESAWPRVTAHLGVHSDGRVLLIHPAGALDPEAEHEDEHERVKPKRKVLRARRPPRRV